MILFIFISINFYPNLPNVEQVNAQHKVDKAGNLDIDFLSSKLYVCNWTVNE